MGFRVSKADSKADPNGWHVLQEGVATSRCSARNDEIRLMIFHNLSASHSMFKSCKIYHAFHYGVINAELFFHR